MQGLTLQTIMRQTIPLKCRVPGYIHVRFDITGNHGNDYSIYMYGTYGLTLKTFILRLEYFI